MTFEQMIITHAKIYICVQKPVNGLFKQVGGAALSPIF